MLKKLPIVIFIVMSSFAAHAQIYINGGNPSRYRGYGGSAGISSFGISIGTLLWEDKADKGLPGYSKPVEGFAQEFFDHGLDQWNGVRSFGLYFEKGFSEKIALKSSLSYGKMYTGILTRSDLLVSEDKSSFGQASFIGKLNFSNPTRVFQFSWLLGPELIYAQKKAIIHEYVINPDDEPTLYRQNVKIMEVALISGFELGFVLNQKFVVSSTINGGVSLPGKGLKLNFVGGFGYRFGQ